MANKIGMRVYRISVNERRVPDRVVFNHPSLKTSVDTFVSQFIANHSTAIQNNILERSWYFEPKTKPATGRIDGYIHYGTFGFESNFKNAKTNKQNYRRKVDDVEEIPLFFEFWCPPTSKYGLVSFQSFQGRSCIQIIIQAMKQSFENNNPDYIINFFKLQPTDDSGAFAAAPVRQVRLIKKKAAGDVADRYLNTHQSSAVDIEIRIAARRKGNLGALGELMSSFSRKDSGVILHEGIEFPEAVAEVRIGDKPRKVSLIGMNDESGVIDLSDSIIRGPDGHPTFASLKKESNSLLADFYKKLGVK